MQFSSMFICNCNMALHVSDAFCVHLQEHLETVVAASGEWHAAACHSPEAATTVSKCSWRWTQKASETCRAILQLQINILPSCIMLVLFVYINEHSVGTEEINIDSKVYNFYYDFRNADCDWEVLKYWKQDKNFNYKILWFWGETFDWDIMGLVNLQIIIRFTSLCGEWRSSSRFSGWATLYNKTRD